MSDVIMTAYNEATEPDLIERLGQVGKALRRFNIRALHDHKGILYVDWTEQPMTQDIAAVSRIWRRENEDGVNHYVGGRELVCDVNSYNPWAVAGTA